MYINLNGVCKNCGKQIQVEFNSRLGDCGGKLYSTECPYCHEEFSSPCVERIYRICDALVSHALTTDSFVVDSIQLVRLKEDPLRPTAQQAEQLLQKERLKEIEAAFGDRG